MDATEQGKEGGVLTPREEPFSQSFMIHIAERTRMEAALAAERKRRRRSEIFLFVGVLLVALATCSGSAITLDRHHDQVYEDSYSLWGIIKEHRVITYGKIGWAMTNEKGEWVEYFPENKVLNR